MSADLDRCRNATAAALDVVLSECEGREGRLGELGDNLFAFIPESALGFDPDDIDRDDDDAVAAAMEDCIGSEFAEALAEQLLGDAMSRRNLRHARRSICEQLVS